MTQKYDASSSVVRRLPRYYRLLGELERSGQVRTSSRELGRRLGMTASQIRQDLCCFGCFGQQGSGYSVAELRENLQRIMGLSEQLPAIVVGAGSLGKVVSENVRFEQRGFRLVGIFDDSPDLIGRMVRGMEVQPTKSLEKVCRNKKPEVAILCIPKEAAPALVDRLLAAGVRGFWNFSHYDINYQHPDVVVENVHLGDSLMTLSYQLKKNG